MQENKFYLLLAVSDNPLAPLLTQNAVMAEEPVIVLHFAGVVPLEALQQFAASSALTQLAAVAATYLWSAAIMLLQ